MYIIIYCSVKSGHTMSWQNRVQIISNIEISYRLDGCYTKNIRILHNIIIVMYYTVKKKKLTAIE